MASVMIGLWQLAISMIIFSHISAAYPSLERHQRQAEARVADYLGTLRELERTHNLLQSIMNSKRRDPNTFRARDVSGFADNLIGDWKNSEETCLQIVQKLNARPSWTCVLLLMVTVIHVQAQTTDCHVNNNSPQIEENNLPGQVVTTIEKGPGVTVTIDPTSEYPGFFEINGTQLILKHSLDYETTSAIYVRLNCWSSGVEINTVDITVFVINVNDNSPVFKEANITVSISEDTKVNTTVVPQGNVTATDADLDTVFYSLTGSPLEATDYFNIQGVNNPAIYLHKALDYEKINLMQLTLYAMDGTAGAVGVHTATATITIHVLQADLRPPWFQPCIFIADSKVCVNRGYTGKVNISEMVVQPLILNPGPLYAVDGDVSLNEKVEYRIVDGNDNDTFSVNRDTGNITMNKPANTLRTFMLYIMASQANNPFRFSQTTVEINVVRRNDHEPYFEKTTYLGTVSVELPPFSLVMDAGIPSRPLRIFAADEDFPDNVNPDITYQIQNSTNFTVVQDGFLLTTEVLNSASTVTLLAVAIDKTTLEEAKTRIIIDVTPLASTTTVPTTTTTTTSAPNSQETRTTISNPSGPSLTTGINNTLSTFPSGSSTILPASTTSNAGLTGSTGSNTASGPIIPPFATTINSPIITANTSQSQTTKSPTTGISQASRTSNVGLTASGSITPPLVTTVMSPIITVNTSQSPTTSSPVTRTSQATIHPLPTTTRTTTASQAGSTKSPTAATDVVSLSTARITSQSENTTSSTTTTTTTSRTTQSTAHSSSAVKTPQSTSLTSTSTTTHVTAATTASATSGSESSPEKTDENCEKTNIILGATLGSLLAISLVLLGLTCLYYKRLMNQRGGADGDQLSSGSTNHSFQDDDMPDSGENDDTSLARDESESDDPRVPLGTPPPSKKAMESSQAPSTSSRIEEGDEGEGSNDSEKEVKSILTKDRRVEDDGYKAVWFKEDTDLDAKDDVVMIEADSDIDQNDDGGDDRDDEYEGDDRDYGRGSSDIAFVPEVLSGDVPDDHFF
uniref:cadherin-related family member 5 n=1 Tax=Euleptes europaea TaxID=460621 RepID=UPI002540F63A|nr:cadherin-related family member 5 [Euleptes europaea]